MPPADPRKAAEWRARFDRFESDDQSIAQFCRENKISRNRFQYWRTRLGSLPVTPSAPEEPEWLQVKPDPLCRPSPQPHNTALPSGVRVRIGTLAIELDPGFDTAVLASVLDLVEERAC